MTTHDTDLIVVGAGICGSEAARYARTTGTNTLHIAPTTPAHSTAGAAILRATWLPKHLKHHLPATLAHYGNAITCTGAIVTSTYRHPWNTPTQQTDWHLVHPSLPLTPPDIDATVTDAYTTPTGVHIETTTGDTYTARAAVLATGATSTLSPPGDTTWGITWTGPTDDLTWPDQLRIHHYATYKAISAGPATGHARVGSSSGATPDKARTNADKLLTRAHNANLITTPDAYTPQLGARLKTQTHIHRYGPALYWVGGHHRLGYSLGILDARTTVDHARTEGTP